MQLMEQAPRGAITVLAPKPFLPKPPPPPELMTTAVEDLLSQAEPSDVSAAVKPQSADKEQRQVKGRLVVTRPWPSMARTVWGDAELASSPGCAVGGASKPHTRRGWHASECPHDEGCCLL